jgi:hypothetical protein
MAEAQAQPLLRRLKNGIDLLLVIDVFVVIAGALWFGVAVVCHSQTDRGTAQRCFSGSGSRCSRRPSAC